MLATAGFDWRTPGLNVLLPVGITFYTFQALSYTMDLYRGQVKAERHLGRYALYVSFFPQLVAGPIERSTHLLGQFTRRNRIDYHRMKSGIQLMVWGLFKKMVIADRLAYFVDAAYSDLSAYGGGQLLVASVFFAFQIYCDFSAYSDIAIGAARVLGYDLMQNFNRPYFARSTRDFWRRWHISLSTWFRDYVYIPLGGNRLTPLRTSVNIFLVFLVCGLWHGASWNFVVWGGLHGIYLIAGRFTAPLRGKVRRALRISEDNPFLAAYQISTTFTLVLLGWIFFRAETLPDALLILGKICTAETLSLQGLSNYVIALDRPEFLVSLVAICALLLLECIHSRCHLGDWLNARNLWLRYAVYMAVIYTIIIFGMYGEYSGADFIYFKF